MDANALVHVIGHYGKLSRRDLGQITKSPPVLLDRLLRTLCDLGQLQAAKVGDETVYKAVVNW